jgi:hypothetical protein
MNKKMRRVLVAAIAGCGLALGAGGAIAQPLCSTITTIGAWENADGGCDIGDKNWTLNTEGENLLSATIAFSFIGSTYLMQITNFDNSDLAGAWTLNYTIAVLDPTQHIRAMFAGADNPGGETPGFGTSLLTKDVIGDPGGPFTLTDVSGAERRKLAQGRPQRDFADRRREVQRQRRRHAGPRVRHLLPEAQPTRPGTRFAVAAGRRLRRSRLVRPPSRQARLKNHESMFSGGASGRRFVFMKPRRRSFQYARRRSHDPDSLSRCCRFYLQLLCTTVCGRVVPTAS